MLIRLEQIRMDGGTQPRSVLNFDTIDEYAEAMLSGAKFPAVTIYYDGESYWLGDGFHRVRAAWQNSAETIEAEIVQGTIDDAKWHSFGANQKHGLRRTNEDKQRAVQAALQHPKSQGLSDREIARHIGVHHDTVAEWRKRLEPASVGNRQIDSRTVTRGGTTYQQNVSNIGRRESPESLPPITKQQCERNQGYYAARGYTGSGTDLLVGALFRTLHSINQSAVNASQLETLERAYELLTSIIARAKDSSAVA